MIVIYRKSDGIVIGENPDDAKAEFLAGQYGSNHGIRVIETGLNGGWLEKEIRVKVKEAVWREWFDPLWRNANNDTQRAVTQPAGDWQMIESGHFTGEHIGETAPGANWRKTQDEEFQTLTVRAGTLSIDATTGAVLLDKAPAAVVETVESIDLETRAAIRSRFSVSDELKMARLSRVDSQDGTVLAFDAEVEAELEKGRTRKAGKGGA